MQKAEKAKIQQLFIVSPQYYKKLREGRTKPIDLTKIEKGFVKVLRNKVLTTEQKLAIFQNALSIKMSDLKKPEDKKADEKGEKKEAAAAKPTVTVKVNDESTSSAAPSTTYSSSNATASETSYENSVLNAFQDATASTPKGASTYGSGDGSVISVSGDGTQMEEGADDDDLTLSPNMPMQSDQLAQFQKTPGKDEAGGPHKNVTVRKKERRNRSKKEASPYDANMREVYVRSASSGSDSGSSQQSSSKKSSSKKRPSVGKNLASALDWTCYESRNKRVKRKK